MLTIRDWSNQY